MLLLALLFEVVRCWGWWFCSPSWSATLVVFAALSGLAGGAFYSSALFTARWGRVAKRPQVADLGPFP